jgi:hypothetical protein
MKKAIAVEATSGIGRVIAKILKLSIVSEKAATVDRIINQY